MSTADLDMKDKLGKYDKFMPQRPTGWSTIGIGGEFWLRKSTFDKWWTEEVAPLFESAIEVHGWVDREGCCGFGAKSGRVRPDMDTHTALLINITPIKDETAEDLLRDLVRAHDSAGIVEYKRAMMPKMPIDAINRARAYLKMKEK